jgi:hypothetical protein
MTAFNIHNFPKLKQASATSGLNYEDYIRQDGFTSVSYAGNISGIVYEPNVGWATHQLDEHEFTVFVLKWK